MALCMTEGPGDYTPGVQSGLTADHVGFALWLAYAIIVTIYTISSSCLHDNHCEGVTTNLCRKSALSRI